MYPQGVCRIRKPACAGNGCAIFSIFQTADWGQKIRYPAADDLFRTSLITNFLTFTPFAKAGVPLDTCFCAKVVQTARMTSLPLFIASTPTIDIEPKK